MFIVADLASLIVKVSECGQEMPQSHTTYQTMAPRGRVKQWQHGIIRRAAKKTVVVIYKVMYAEHCEKNLRIEAIELSTMNHLMILVYMH